MKSFWASNGTKLKSYADNPGATAAWFERLTSPTIKPESLWLISFIKDVLLEPERLSRPTSAQVFERLKDVHLPSNRRILVGTCCSQNTDEPDSSFQLARPNSIQMPQSPVGLWRHWLPTPDVFGVDTGLEIIILDTNLRVLACKDDLNLQHDIKRALSDRWDLYNLIIAVKRLLARAPDTLTQGWYEWSQITFVEFVKSVSISCPSHIDAEMTRLRLRMGQEAPRNFTVRIMLMTLQLERRPMHGAPFIAMVFDPAEPKDERVYENGPSETKQGTNMTHWFPPFPKTL